jgi:hypothetical protein
MTIVAIIALAMALLALALRRVLAQRGSGRLAQVAFRKQHGARVARLLDGEVDQRPHSPWIAIQVDGRPARMVAAPLAGRLQAGIELYERTIPLNIWLTDGTLDELELPDDVDAELARSIVARLRAADVDSCSTIAPIEQSEGMPHVLRMQFDDVDELPDRIARIAPLLTELESIAPRPADERRP